jgi:hypothetical protein
MTTLTNRARRNLQQTQAPISAIAGHSAKAMTERGRPRQRARTEYHPQFSA